MFPFLQSLLNWAISALDQYGYAIVFAATILENLFIVGSFTPGDVITAAAAFSATTAAGHSTSIWGLFAAAVLGTWVGSNISYLVGARGGRSLIENLGPRFGISIEAIEAGEQYFERQGPVTIVFARFVAVMKNLAPTLAGASRMKLWVFELYSFVGALMYAGILIAVGWFLGANFQQGLKYYGAFSWLMFVILIVIVTVAVQGKRRRDRLVVAREAASYEAEHGRLCSEDDADSDGEPTSTDCADDDA
jgi:membrane-associated protein